MPHPNATAYDAVILAKLQSAPYATMPQGGTTDYVDANGVCVDRSAPDSSPDPRTADDDAICAQLNAETVAVAAKQDVAIADIESYLALQGRLAVIENYAATGTFTGGAGDQSLVAAKELIRIISSPRLTVFQMSDAAKYAGISSFLDALEAASLITADDKTAILAMADETPIPWWQSIGAPGPLNRFDLHRARS